MPKTNAAAVNPDHLQNLARVMLRTGLNLAHGQQLVLTAPVEALPLVRAIAAEAYRVPVRRWSPRC
ncbi:MAG: aminopeptidase [Paracoccaceae bacterium]